MQKGNLLHVLNACFLLSSLCVFCSCSTIKAQEIFGQPVGVALNTEISRTVFRINHLGNLPSALSGHDVLDRTVMKWWRKWLTKGRASMSVDYARLGRELVGLLLGSLEYDGFGSAKSLEKLARDWQPLADEKTIDREILLFHKFLLVQACAGTSISQSVSDRVIAAFYESLDQVGRGGDTQPPFGTEADTLASLERLWVIRANQYEEPFALDLEEFSEHRPGHVPWSRLIVRFMRNFREPSGQVHDMHDILREVPESVRARVTVNVTFVLYFENATEIIISHFGQKS